jgi:hypothetical protein
MLAMCGVAILLTDDREMLILVMVHRNEYRKVVSSSSSVIVIVIVVVSVERFIIIVVFSFSRHIFSRHPRKIFSDLFPPYLFPPSSPISSSFPHPRNGALTRSDDGQVKILHFPVRQPYVSS